tara:strand:- start:5008 stop:5328 length:321 start_codon:yes stop_codon:yes gene_type:complete
MRTKLLLIASLLLIGGCHAASEKSEVQPTVVPPPAVVEAPPVEVEPVQPVVPQKPLPSHNFRKGYWDGYTGVWLGPVSWTLSPDYRHGWAIGNKDRKEGREPQYQK